MSRDYCMCHKQCASGYVGPFSVIQKVHNKIFKASPVFQRHSVVWELSQVSPLIPLPFWMLTTLCLLHCMPQDTIKYFTISPGFHSLSFRKWLLMGYRSKSTSSSLYFKDVLLSFHLQFFFSNEKNSSRPYLPL